MRGLLAKTLREVRGATLLAGVALCVFMGLLTFILPQLLETMGDVVSQMTFARTMISALLGIDIETEVTAQVLQAILWVHPVVLAVLWAHEIALCTRVPAGEIDRGTIDILLGLPVSRRQIYWCESGVWLVTGVFVLAFGVTGHLAVASLVDLEGRPPLAGVLIVAFNLLCVYIAVGGVGYLVSALSSRRGRAILVTLGIVLLSFFLNFVARLWEPARSVAFLGVLEYYQPARALRDGGFPWRDVTVLLVVGATAWAAGGEVMARRSIATV